MGLGVDQVLQIEMVLPSGDWVRFGPTETIDEGGFLYPRTLKVSGVCANPNSPDKSSGIYLWEQYPDDKDIDFDDLWFAMLGGGKH